MYSACRLDAGQVGHDNGIRVGDSPVCAPRRSRWSEPSSYTWTLGKMALAGAMLAYSGVDTTNPIDASQWPSWNDQVRFDHGAICYDDRFW